MSYDFSMTIDTGGEYPSDVGDLCLNYTYNVSGMFRKAFPGEDGVNQLNGLSGQDCIPLLEEAISQMESYPAVYSDMNPENGWGDSLGATELLRQIKAACNKDPKATLSIT